MLATDPSISFKTSGTMMSIGRIIEHIKKNMAGGDMVLDTAVIMEIDKTGIATTSENMAKVTIKTDRHFCVIRCSIF